MKISVICVGKLKENYFVKAVEEYAKRLRLYCKLEIIELADEKTPDGASAAEERKIKELEGQRILKSIKEDALVIALAIEGKMMSSEEFSEEISRIGLQGGSHIVFIIGGSLGLSEAVLQRADRKLSFSEMTFPHQLMRVILLEQVYRAYRIMYGQPYHK